MKYSGAEIIIKLLERQGIQIVPGIPGGANLPLYHALRKSKIRHILTRHEQGAGFIAQGMARSTGKAAVCFATSGPGATNLVTAIADAKLDSVPIVAITGQVSSALIGTDAFQEVDTFGMTLPVTKHNFLVTKASELLKIVPKAFRIAQSGRPGPVLIDVPKDVQLETVEFEDWPSDPPEEQKGKVNERLLDEIAKAVNESERPVLYIGGGIVQSGAQKLIIEFARKNSIPVAVTLMGLGCYPFDDPLYLGMLGMHGARSTNRVMAETDLLLAFGVRFDDRATGKVSKFCPKAKVVHVDIDPSEIGKIKKADFSVVGDIGSVLKDLMPLLSSNGRSGWTAYVRETKKEHDFPGSQSNDPFHPINIVKEVSRFAPEDAIITTDVGQHQMWIAQAYPFKRPRTLLTSGGLGTMGFGLPAAIGAALAHPGKKVICFTGDGSLLMNVQELATLKDLNLDVTVIVMNNQHLGMVRQQQEFFYGKNYIASRFESNPDFVAIACGFGVRGVDLEGTQNPAEILERTLAEEEPCVINVPIHGQENVYPMVPPGAGNCEMIGGMR